MNETTDRLLVDWLMEGPDRGPIQSLERALAATRRTSQRPGWTILERWSPMQLTMRPAVNLRPYLVFLAALLLIVAAGALFVIGSQRRTAPPFGLAGNGAMVIGVVAAIAGAMIVIAVVIGAAVLIGTAILDAMVLGRAAVHARLAHLGAERVGMKLGAEIAHSAAEVAHTAEVAASETATEVAAAKTAARLRVCCETKNAE